MKRIIFSVLLVFCMVPGLKAAEPTLDLSPARWIWYPSERTLANSMMLFRKEFILDKVPDKVAGWVLADSRYLLYVNGKRVQWGPAPFDPRWPEADPLDIRPYLKEGQNIIACQVLYYGVGDGTAPIGKPGFIFKLDLEDLQIVSDKSWSSSVTRSWPPGGYKRYYQRAFQEHFDANLHPYGWETSAFTAGPEWLPAMELEGRADRSQLATNYPEYAFDYKQNNRNTSEIRPRSIPMLDEYEVPVLKLSENMWLDWSTDPSVYFEFNTPGLFTTDRTPCTTVNTADGSWQITASGDRAAVLTFEFEEQIVGFPYFTIHAPAGTIVELLTHEAHQNGGPELLNTHYNAWSRFTCKEGENRFEAFDYEGLRWLQLHIRNFEGQVSVRNVGARRRIYPWPHAAEIQLSEPTLQRLMEATVNTLNNSAQDLIVDGMGRERQQYSGDCGHQIHPIISTFGDTELSRRFLVTFSQGITKDGYFLDCWPAYDRLARLMQRQLDLSGWGPLLDHGVGFFFDNYHYYMHTGDATVLDETLPRLLRFFDYLTSIVGDDGLVPVEDIGIPSVWIDHHAYKRNKEKILAFNLYIVAMGRNALIPLCEAGGQTDRIDQIGKFSDDLWAKCIEHYWCPKRKVFINNLPWEAADGYARYDDRSLATAVLYDLCPGRETARSVQLLADVPEELGLSYPPNAIWRLWALVKARRIDVVLDELRGRWAAMPSIWLNNTLSEDWVSKPDARDQWSHCPIAPLIMLHQGIAGIRPLDPGYSRFEIAPQLGDLGNEAFTVHTVKGPVDFETSGQKGKRKLRFTVPENSTVELVLHEDEKVNYPEISHDPATAVRRYLIEGSNRVEISLKHM